MKKIIPLFAILSLVMVWTSCGSDKPDDLPVSQDASATKSVNIIAAAGNVTSTEIVFNLTDFAALTKYSKWVKSGLVQTTSIMTISQLADTQDVKLTDVKLSLASNSKTNLPLPNISNNVTFKELPQLNFLQSVINEVVSKGSSRVVLSYKTATNITSPAKFEIKIDGKFSF